MVIASNTKLHSAASALRKCGQFYYYALLCFTTQFYYSDIFVSIYTCLFRIKVYTKNGDKGTTSLYNGEKAAKDAVVFHALGDVDELNSGKDTYYYI